MFLRLSHWPRWRDDRGKRLRLVHSLVVSAFLANTGLAGLVEDRWLDTVVLFDRPTGSSNEGGPATDALGPNDGSVGFGHVSIDIPETLIVGFTNNTAMDGAGMDLMIYEIANGDSEADIFGSEMTEEMLGPWVYLGRANGDTTYDLAAYGELEFVNYLKFVGLDDGGGWAGFDLDAVEALNSGPWIPEPATLVLLAVGGLIAARRRY